MTWFLPSGVISDLLYACGIHSTSNREVLMNCQIFICLARPLPFNRGRGLFFCTRIVKLIWVYRALEEAHEWNQLYYNTVGYLLYL